MTPLVIDPNRCINSRFKVKTDEQDKRTYLGDQRFEKRDYGLL